MITDEEISEIEDLISKLSPGPWHTPEECEKTYTERKEFVIPPLDHKDCYVWPWKRKEDMVFAYKARELVPKLLNEINKQKPLKKLN